MAKKKLSDGNKTGSSSGNAAIAIKKYANRRLYNTATSSYVTLDDLAQMVKDGSDFSVHDAKSGKDITRSVLTQIIVDEESKGHNLLPVGFLRDIISLYGDSLQSLVPGYLDQSMRSFTNNQERMRGYLENSMGSLMPINRFEEMGRQNMAIFENAVKMFAPFQGDETHGHGEDKGSSVDNGAGKTGKNDGPNRRDEVLEELKDKIEMMQKQLDGLGSPRE